VSYDGPSSHHGRRGPRSLAEAFGTLTEQLAPPTLLADVQRAWSATVGEAIAAQAQPTAERGGVVTVSCAASVWAQELDLMAPQIIAQLNAALAGVPVRRLRCVAVGHGR
jgi:predicted nucleic acid-binding Zn ribbon protein